MRVFPATGSGAALLYWQQPLLFAQEITCLVRGRRSITIE